SPSPRVTPETSLVADGQSRWLSKSILQPLTPDFGLRTPDLLGLWTWDFGPGTEGAVLPAAATATFLATPGPSARPELMPPRPPSALRPADRSCDTFQLTSPAASAALTAPPFPGRWLAPGGSGPHSPRRALVALTPTPARPSLALPSGRSPVRPRAP